MPDSAPRGPAWRTALVAEAMEAFAEDLDYAVDLVSTPDPPRRRRRKAARPDSRRVRYGGPPRYAADPPE